MSTPLQTARKFPPAENPVATATKKCARPRGRRSTSSAGLKASSPPIGGQAQYAYPPFASRCRAIHGWYGLDGIHYIAYLCETNIYVDIHGRLDRHHPLKVDGMIAPVLPGVGGYSDGL